MSEKVNLSGFCYLALNQVDFTSEIEAQVANPIGLSERHKELLASLSGDG
jgi:hypothetical protein